MSTTIFPSSLLQYYNHPIRPYALPPFPADSAACALLNIFAPTFLIFIAAQSIPPFLALSYILRAVSRLSADLLVVLWCYGLGDGALRKREAECLCSIVKYGERIWGRRWRDELDSRTAARLNAI